MVGARNGLRTGPPSSSLIRVPVSVANLVTALLVFDLVRLRRPAGEAAPGAAPVTCSPVSFVISRSWIGAVGASRSKLIHPDP
jgi:hypothetical protein